MDVAQLVIDFKAQTASAQAQVGALDKKVEGLQATVGRATNMMANFAKGLAIGAVVAFGAAALKAAKDSLALADSLKDVSEVTGVGTDALQAWRHGAELSASSGETFDNALKKLVKTIGEARSGNEAAAESFRRLGLEDLIKKGADTETIVKRLADAIRSIEDPAVAAALATDVMGKNAGELIPLLSGGEAGLRKFETALKDTGAYMSKETVNELAAVADETKELTAVFNKLAADANLVFLRVVAGAKMMVTDLAVEFQRLAVLYTQGLRGVAAFDNKRIMDQGAANERKHSQAKHGDRTPFVPVDLPDLAKPPATPQRNEAAEAIKREQKAIEDLIEDLQFEHSLIGQTAEQQAVMNNLRQLGASATEEQRVKVEAWTRENFRAQEELRKVAELEQFAADIRARYGDGTEQLAAHVAMLNDAMARGLITAEQYGEALNEALKTDDMREAEAQWKAIGDQAKSGLADTLIDIATGTRDAKEAMAEFVEEIGRAIAKMLILKAIEAGVNAIFGVVSGKALGGLVNAGNAYMVGESGPELFVPRATGQIVPNNRMGGGSQLAYAPVYNIQAGVNAHEVRMMLHQHDRDLLPRFLNAVDDKSRRSTTYLRPR